MSQPSESESIAYGTTLVYEDFSIIFQEQTVVNSQIVICEKFFCSGPRKINISSRTTPRPGGPLYFRVPALLVSLNELSEQK